MTNHSNDDVRDQFTQVGSIMEDASVVALIWDPADMMTAKDRLDHLTQTHRQIEELLRSIKSVLEIH